ncbi:MAG TPA: hypothetical protein ENI92_04980 [Bacteroidetes bacterium]|nr:hypothetical protein [Bacteroidota bacterium]
MIRRKARWVAGVITVALALAFIGAGCTKYASEEDLKNLDTQKQAALSAEKKVGELKKEKAALESQKAQKENELGQAEAEKAKVEQRLAEESGGAGQEMEGDQ